MKRMLTMLLIVLTGLGRADVADLSRLSVTLDANGGSVSRSAINYSNMRSSLNLPTPTRSGYVFKYWTTECNVPSTKVSASESAYDLALKGKVRRKTGKVLGDYLSSYTSSITLYAYWGLEAPRPSATDGKYASSVKVTWPKVARAVKYKIRRATKPDYAKAKTLAVVTSTTYKDREAACHPKKRFYYWVLPYDSRGVGTVSKSLYDVGHSRLGLTVSGPSYLYTGESWQCSATITDPCVAPACSWKISAGRSYASVDRYGVVTAKKRGTATLRVEYDGLRVEIPIIVCRKGDPVPSLYNSKTVYSK